MRWKGTHSRFSIRRADVDRRWPKVWNSTRGWAIRRHRRSCILSTGDFAAFLDHGKPGKSGCSVCITLASAGYPDVPRVDDPIAGIAEAEAAGATVFQAGTKQQNGNLVTAGGRVLGVTAGADSLPAAIDRAMRPRRIFRLMACTIARTSGAKVSGVGRLQVTATTGT